MAFVYVSYAKERERAGSDVDLVVVGEFPKEKFMRQIRSLESKLNREINFITYTPKEFEKESKKDGGFLNLILRDKIFMLKGKLPSA